jgi:hypothetical protein
LIHIRSAHAVRPSIRVGRTVTHARRFSTAC